MFSKIWIINFTLFLLTVFFGVKAYGIWFEGEKTGLEALGSNGTETGIEIEVVKRGMSPESAYEIIVQKDLFTPERAGAVQEGPVLEKKAGSALTVHGKKVVLYGVVITDSCEMALISNPGAGKGEKGTVWIKADETIGGLKVTGIKEDRVFVTEGGRDYALLLYDRDRPKGRSAATKGSSSAAGMTKQKIPKRREITRTEVGISPEKDKVIRRVLNRNDPNSGRYRMFHGKPAQEDK